MYEALVESISANVPHADNEYMGEDGLLHCSACHRAVQTRVEFAGIKKTVRCVCDCKLKEFKQREEQQKREALERKRRICFAETNMADWTFENDDRKNPKLSNAMERYAEQFKDFRRDSKGLLLFGTVGTGKTYYAACIANRLIDHGYPVLMTNFARLTNQIQGMYEGILHLLRKESLYLKLEKYDLHIQLHQELPQ